MIGLIVVIVVVSVIAMLLYTLRWRDEKPARAPLPDPARDLDTPARQRHDALVATIASVESAYGDDLTLEASRHALHELRQLHVRLLISQRTLLTMPVEKNDEDIRRQIGVVKADLERGGSEDMRASKEATLQILQTRLTNAGRRSEALQQIESDLQRIEAQVDLALEQTILGGAPVGISRHIELTSGPLDPDRLDSSSPDQGPQSGGGLERQ